MAKTGEARIHGVHKKLMREFICQLNESISEIESPIIKTVEPAIRKNDSGWNNAIYELPASLLEEHSGPDRINEIRNEVAATAPASIRRAEILNPDKQNELMEITRQRSDEFELELRRIPSLEGQIIETSLQKFKDELIENIRKQLTARIYRRLESF